MRDFTVFDCSMLGAGVGAVLNIALYVVGIADNPFAGFVAAGLVVGAVARTGLAVWDRAARWRRGR